MNWPRIDRTHSEPGSEQHYRGVGVLERGNGTRRRALCVAVLMAALVSVAQAGSASARGNAAAAHACQRNGYSQLVRADGSPFTNGGSCVSYVAQGGTLVAVALHATFTPNPSRGVFQDLTVTGSGLLPGSTVSYSFIAYSTGTRSATSVIQTVAPDGTFLAGWPTGCPLDHDFEFYATTAYGTPIVATGCQATSA